MTRFANTVWSSHLLRAVALLIAIAAVVDPSITSMRRARPLLSVVAADTSRDSALVAQVGRQLDRRYTVLNAPLSSAVGTVLVGERLPDASGALAAPVIVVSAIGSGPSVRMRRIEAPAQAMLDSRVTVAVTLATRATRAAGAASPVLDVELAHGTLVVARNRIVLSRDTVVVVPLTFVPTAAEVATLQARAFISGQRDTARHDVVVDVRERRWSVLFFDRRPSWMSTFVRRALERDPRFAVTSRVITSTNVSRETGRPPLGLDALAVTGAFDAVVIGAPDALTARDVDGISTLLRSRGASVLILADHAATSVADGLLDFGGWRTGARRVPAELTAPALVDRVREPLRLKGLAIGFPTRLPTNASPVAVLQSTTDTGRTPDASQTVIWRMPVGLGQLVVSGAFDAWRFRDTAQSTFDATWRDLIDAAASQRQQALELRLTRTLVEPRARVIVTITSRDSVTTSPARASLRDPRAPDAARTPILFADAAIGASREAMFRAPDAPGVYEVLATAGVDSARASFVVAAAVARDADDAPEVLAAWASSRSGRVVSRDQLDSLTEIVAATVRPVPRMTVWHPMRSPWWIVPFALALAGEWWIRRRRGLA